MEAVEFPEARPIDAVKAALAKAHAAEREKPALEVIRLAREEFPDFEPNLRALCR
jgi:hypothetical protein